MPIHSHASRGAFEPAVATDRAAILSLVGASRLPLDGLDRHLDGLPNLTFVLRAPDGAVRACAVVERHGAYGLLRSVAVRAGEQGRGTGRALVQSALAEAANAGASPVYLLTETAAPFFARLGFVPLKRPAAPDAIRQSGEFASVCPASAQLMVYDAAAFASDARPRPAREDDIDAIVRIYNDGIEDRLGTFETRPRTASDVRQWFDGRHPLVVVPGHPNGAVAAFAATFDYRPRACYAGIAEFSVYTAREARGQGHGRRALEALIAAAEAAGFWKLISRVFVENTASRRLMRHLDFREVGIYEKHGQLDGRWRDVVVVERLLGEVAR